MRSVLVVLMLLVCAPVVAAEPGLLIGTNQEWGGNINATNGVSSAYLAEKTPLGDLNKAFTVTILYRDNVGDRTETDIVMCDPSFGIRGVVDLKTGEIYQVDPDEPSDFDSGLAFFDDVWHSVCLDDPSLYRTQ